MKRFFKGMAALAAFMCITTAVRADDPATLDARISEAPAERHQRKDGDRSSHGRMSPSAS